MCRVTTLCKQKFEEWVRRMVYEKCVKEAKANERLLPDKEVFVNGSILIVFCRIDKILTLIDLDRGS